jgi:hypothetical protein
MKMRFRALFLSIVLVGAVGPFAASRGVPAQESADITITHFDVDLDDYILATS